MIYMTHHHTTIATTLKKKVYTWLHLLIVMIFGSFVVLWNAQWTMEPSIDGSQSQPVVSDIVETQPIVDTTTTTIDPAPVVTDIPDSTTSSTIVSDQTNDTTVNTANNDTSQSTDWWEDSQPWTNDLITPPIDTTTESITPSTPVDTTDATNPQDQLIINTIIDTDTGTTIITTSTNVDTTDATNPQDQLIMNTIIDTDTGTMTVTTPIDTDSASGTVNPQDQLIITTPEDIRNYISQGVIVPSYDPDTNKAKTLLFGSSVEYRSLQHKVQVVIPTDARITSNDQWWFDPLQFVITDVTQAAESADYSSIIIEKYDPLTDTTIMQEDIAPGGNKRVEFHIGVAWNHLIFDKPLKVVVQSDQVEDTLVDLSADHGYGWSKDGITTSESSSCSWWMSDKPETVTTVHDGKVVFWICWASTFSLTYVWWANFPNFADASIPPWFINKTVTFLPGVHFATGSIISDVNISIRRRPIDTENPWLFGTTNCYPNEKYFRLTGPDGTVVNLINAWQLNTPNPNCPETTTTFDDSWAVVITNNYTSWTYRPVQALSAYNNKSPFGTWTLRMGDVSALDGVILYGFTITIKVIDGPLCIYSPVSVLTGIVVKSTSQIIDQQLDYFQVDDQRGLNSWYYTTLQISNLTQSWGGAVIPNTSIQRKADPLVLLWWITNPLVQLGASWSTYTTANTTSTFIYRNTAPNGFKTSRYGSKLRLRVNVPAYASVGMYTGTITYTLYEN